MAKSKGSKGKKTVRGNTLTKKKSVGKKIAHTKAKKINAKEGTYNGIPWESGCELALLNWAFELKNTGYVADIKRSNSFLLSDALVHNYSQEMKRSSKPVQQTISQGHSYTPDYIVTFTKKALGRFCWLLGSPFKWEKHLMIVHQNSENPDLYDAHIEVKPDYDFAGKTAKAVNDMKWVYQKFGVYINLFRPNRWFEGTFTPNEYKFTERGVKRKLTYDVRTMGEYLTKISKT